MSWDQESFLARLKAAVDALDHEGTAELCQELIDRLQKEEALREGMAREVLATLRGKCYFDLMEKVAGALREAGLDDSQVRRQFAQSLIDQEKIPAAAYVLELLVDRTAQDPRENAEARGLLGRIYKQLYVKAVEADPRATGRRLVRQNLQKAVRSYGEVYESDPANYLWQGINAAALALRAERDGVALEEPFDARGTARKIFGLIQATKAAQEAIGKDLDAWSLATAIETSLALGDPEQALIWLSRYVADEDADAFELSSTERQLRKVWGLKADEPPGSFLLPILQSAALNRKFGRVKVTGSQVASTIQQTLQLEKNFGSEKFVPLAWYRMGLERCRAVAQIRDRFGRGLGTGFLLRGRDLAPALSDGFLLLTNAHVVPTAVAPGDAVIAFEALETVAGRQFHVSKVLWSSPMAELDGTLLQLDQPVSGPEPFPIAEQLPANDGQQKVFVIGHPKGGGLSLSMADNALLGYDERLLHYRAPTEGGSSGSPVFDDQWRLVALHHGGGHGLKRLDGPGAYDANEGIRIHRIREAVREAGVSGV